MSIRTLLWAKDQTVITQNVRNKDGKPVASKPAPSSQDKLVLIGIGDEASEKTWDALLGVEDIAVFVGITRRAVRDSLRRLERAGFIRCRETRVESGRSGWQRIYLLAEESPLVKELIEVDFTTTEDVSRFQMRTFRDRHAAGYVPSDSRIHKSNRSPGHKEGERGSPPEAGGNAVPPPRGNAVPPGGERGSSPGGERGSSPFFSTGFSSSSGEADGRTETPTEGEEEAAAAAQEVVQAVDLSKLDPRPRQRRQLAEAVAVALGSGYSSAQLVEYLRGKASEARTMKYLLGAVTPERLAEEITTSSAPRLGVLRPVCGQCEGRDGDHISARVVEDANGRNRKCPRCHPHATTQMADSA